MADLSDFDACVEDFMDEFGGEATLTTYSDQGVYDPSTGDYVAGQTDYPVRAILLDLTLKSNGLQTVPNTLIEVGDKRCFIQPRNKTDSTLTMPVISPAKDKLTMGNKTYKILTAKDTNPTATNSVLIELILKE